MRTIVLGADEAGWGSIAGPLCVGAVAMPEDYTVEGLNDSKKLTPRRRQLVEENLRHDPLVEAAVGIVSAEEINAQGPAAAYLVGYKRALTSLLARHPQATLYLDGEERNLHAILRWLRSARRTVVHQPNADQTFACVMGASVVAKVRHDAIMLKLAETYPAYGFDKHQGYGTATHIAAVQEHGPCPEHRRAYGPVRRYLLKQQQEASKTTLAEDPSAALGLPFPLHLPDLPPT